MRRMGWLSVLFLGPVIAAMVTLATPAGQHWAVEEVLKLATASMGDGAERAEVQLDHVGLSFSPAGLSLAGLRVNEVDSSGAARPLLSADALVLMPKDKSGRHWSSLELSGFEISPAGWTWLQQGEVDSTIASEPTAPLPDVSVDFLRITDATVPLSVADAGSSGSMRLLLDSATIEGFTLVDNRPVWAATEGGLRLVAEHGIPHEGDTTTVSWSGGGDSAFFTAQSDPAYWLRDMEGMEEYAPLIPEHWTGALAWTDSALRCTGQAPWGSLHAHLALTAEGLQFDDLGIQYHTLPEQLEGWGPHQGKVQIQGPVSLNVPMATAPGGSMWDGLSGAPTVEWTSGRKGSALQRMACQWNLGNGDVTFEGRLHGLPNGPAGPPHVAWRMEGAFVPVAQLGTAPLSLPLSIAGNWSGQSPGNAAGSGQAEGDLQVTLTPSPAGQATTELAAKWNGRSAPLKLSESLDLYGDWSGEGACTLDAAGLLEDWWGHLNLAGARFIPLAGFDGRARLGAPVSMKRTHIACRGDADHFELDMSGDFADAKMSGPTDPSAWVNPLLSAIASGGLISQEALAKWRLPSGGKTGEPGEDWTLELEVWRDDILERYSRGQWSIGPGSHVACHQREGEVYCEAALHPLHLGPVRVHGLAMHGSGGRTPLSWTLEADSARHTQWGQIDHVHMGGDVALDKASRLQARWDGYLSGSLDMVHALTDGQTHSLYPRAVHLDFDGASWNLQPDSASSIVWSGTDWRTLRPQGISLKGEQGIIGFYAADQDLYPWAAMEIQLDRFPVGPWMDLLGRIQEQPLPNGGGFVHGSAAVGLQQLEAMGELQWQDATVEGIDLGDICLAGKWGQKPEAVLQQFLGPEEVVRMAFRDMHRAEITLNEWPLGLMQPLLESTDINISGSANGQCALSWDDGLPALGGAIDIAADRLFIGATGMDYAVNGRLQFNDAYIGMDLGRIVDPLGNEALLNLSLQHTDFDEWNYDVGLDLPRAFAVMDLPSDPGKLYHGQVFATGEANVSGTKEYMNVEAHAISAEGTKFTMPLDALEGPEMPSGIRFTGGTERRVENTAQSSPALDLSLALDIEVTPEAELSLVLDQRANERIDGRASGTLSFVRNRSRPLAMEGALEIQGGQYRFSLRDLFTKNISIAPGGRIDWDGDPYSAQLELLATAPFKTSVAPLLVQSVGGAAKTEVELGLGITGQITSPVLDFIISFPTYERDDPYTLSSIGTVLNTPEETERQAFALLATGQFITPEQQRFDLLGKTAAAAQASELVSSGISELLSGLSKDVDIGLRYLPSGSAGDADEPLTEDTFEVDLGLRLLNDRLSISGTLGTSELNGVESNDDYLTGTIDIRYQLTADGRWELIGYRKPESNLRDDMQSGIGALYKVRFDHLQDLFKRSELRQAP